jgi:hypothetical protein
MPSGLISFKNSCSIICYKFCSASKAVAVRKNQSPKAKAICNCWLRRTILDIYGNAAERLSSIHHEDGIGPVYRAGQFLQEAGSASFITFTLEANSIAAAAAMPPLSRAASSARRRPNI